MERGIAFARAGWLLMSADGKTESLKKEAVAETKNSAAAPFSVRE